MTQKNEKTAQLDRFKEAAREVEADEADLADEGLSHGQSRAGKIPKSAMM